MSSDKRQLLIDTALNLFYQQGINSVGINEVLTTSGVAKKTLYNHFNSKEELIIAALDSRHQHFLTWLDNELKLVPLGQPADLTFAVTVRLFNALTAWFNNRVPGLSPFNGCFFINATAECSRLYPAVRASCQRHKQQVRQLLQQHLQSQDQQLLNLLCTLKEGAIVSDQVHQDLQAAEKCIPIMQTYLSTQR